VSTIVEASKGGLPCTGRSAARMEEELNGGAKEESGGAL